MSEQSSRRLKAAIILIAVFVFFALCLGIYHCTHGGGWRSGTTELFFAALIAVLTFLVYRNRSGHGSVARFRGFRTALWVVMGLISVTLLCLSVYHFTHQGLRSGIIESSLAAILAVTGYLLR